MQSMSRWLCKGMRLFIFLCTVAIALASAAQADCEFTGCELVFDAEEDEAIMQAPMGPAGLARGIGGARGPTSRHPAGVLHDNTTAPTEHQPLNMRILGDLINSDPFKRPPQDAAGISTTPPALRVTDPLRQHRR